MLSSSLDPLGDESTSESTSIALTENAPAPITTSELSTTSTSISAGITTTSETSTTSAASTQGVPPTVYTANPSIGPGGQIYKELKHFGVHGTIPVNVNKTLDLLEGEYNCLVNTWGWRSPALSNYVEGDKGPCGKQLRTGSQASIIYAPPREKVNRSAAASIIEVKKLIGDSIQVIIDGSSGTGNYHQAWPFLTYLVNNPDDVPGLGTPVYYSTHKVLPERQPRYMYCNIVPLTTSSATIVHVDIKHAEEAEFAAKFAVRAHFIVQLSGKVSCRGDIGIYFVDAKEWLQLSLRVPS
ncbi:hypothetical protein LZL87_012364 [Fusarium oxysporum]|nr:hypothetical protein LZL87_012364 [Fusarium oxysporum]